MIKKIPKNSSGFTLLETLFYAVFLSLLSVVVINSLLVMTKSFRETRVQAEIISSNNIMERISREIKQAYDISSISSTNLVLNTKNEAGTNKTLGFSLSGSNLQLSENSVVTGNLNLPTISVSSLSFTQITTSAGKAVKVSFSVSSANDSLARAYDFYNTAVLRGSY